MGDKNRGVKGQVVLTKCKTMCYIQNMKLPKLVWNQWNRQHIKKHKVTVAEVEEAYMHLYGSSGSYSHREMFYGVTKNKRPITIAVSYKKQKRPYIVSARDMSRKERRKYLYEKKDE